MEVYRAPIHQNEIIIGQEVDKRPRTRCGYLVPDAYSAYEASLGEVGSTASGKALHFAADIICSGGLDIWIRGAYSYAIQHINLANPRIFVYLKHKIQELDKKFSVLPQETFFSNPDVHSLIGESVLILQLCPKRAKITWPKLDDNTKRPGWLRGVAGSPETTATRAVWKSDGDAMPMYFVANELCKAIQDNQSERALFWVRWLIEEDLRVRKETKGHGLSTKERGPAECSQRARTEVGHFICELLVKIYNELASKELIRMHEEFQEIIRIFRGKEKRMPVRLKRDCLGLLTLICCEVPKWKIPAAQTLVKDPIVLSRAVAQSSSFFNEVLANPSLSAEKLMKPGMTKASKKKIDKEKEKKVVSMEEQFDAYDQAMEAYLNRQ